MVRRVVSGNVVPNTVWDKPALVGALVTKRVPWGDCPLCPVASDVCVNAVHDRHFHATTAVHLMHLVNVQPEMSWQSAPGQQLPRNATRAPIPT